MLKNKNKSFGTNTTDKIFKKPLLRWIVAPLIWLEHYVHITFFSISHNFKRIEGLKIRGSRRLSCLPDFRSIAHVSAHQKKTRKASLGFMIAICLLAGAFSLFQILSKVLNSKADSAPTISSIVPASGSIDGGTDVTITGTNLLTGNDSYSKLLIHSDGSGSSHVDSSSGAKAVTANGNATQVTTQSKFGGSSTHFGGSGDYLSVPDSDDWNFGSGNFTVDFWVRLSNVNTYQPLVTQDSNTGTRAWLILASNSTLIWTVPNGTQTTADCLEANTWIHLAVVRNGTVVTIYKNGVSVGSHDYGAGYNIPDGTMPLEIGRQGAYGYSINDGYIDELRISKGIARWTSNFTPSTTRYGSTNVTIGGSQATNISIVGPTTATMTTPAHAAGSTDVVVTNDDNQSATLSSGFAFMEPAPTISSISPDNGLTIGGTGVSISGSNFFYGNDSNAKLLLHADGSGASFSDSSSSAKSITAYGNATQSVTQSKFGGKSAYFDGNSYLTVPISSDFDFGTGDFTIDGWINPSDTSSYKAIFCGHNGAGATNYWFGLLDGKLRYFNNGSDQSGSANIPTGAWTHIAFVKQGTSVSLYVNGSLDRTITGETSNFSYNGSVITIGRQENSESYKYIGYLDELRISKGTARWTSNFTPPTRRYGSTNVTIGGNQATNINAADSTTITATTPSHAAGDVDVVVTNDDSQNATLSNGFTYHNIPAPTISSINPTSGPSVGGTNVGISGTGFGLDGDANTKLLLHADGNGNSISDFSSNPKSITASGNATQTTAQSKFGGKSMYLDGNGDYIQTASSSDFGFGTGDFTVDMWYRPISKPTAYPNIINNGYAWGVNEWGLCDRHDGTPTKFSVYVYNFNTTTPILQSTTSVVNGNWYHLAITRSGSTFRFFVNGVLESTYTNSGNVDGGGTPFFIAGAGSGGITNAYANGYIDELRISKGVARWTSNFTPSTTPYAQPNVAFGGTSVTDLKLESPTNISVATPAHTEGTVDVVVTNTDSQGATLLNAFTFTTPPTISSITPSSGSVNGGDSVTISGSNFVDTPGVTFGGTDAISVNRVDSNTLNVVVPAHNAGAVDVVVTNPDNQEATLINGFTFNELSPTVSSITPISGPSAGGTNVTITGTNFVPQNTGGDAGWAVVSGKTLPTALYGASQAVIGDYVYLFGGGNGSTYFNTIYRAPVSDPTNWTNTGGTLPATLYMAQIAVIGDYVYIFGGYNGTSVLNTIYRAPVSDPTTWINTGKTLPGVLYSSQLIVTDTSIYLLGGRSGTSTWTNVIYSAQISDPTTWSNTGYTLPSNNGGGQIVRIGNSLYLYGGYNGTSALNTIYSATISNLSSWTNTGKTLPAANIWAQSFVNGDYIYILGGSNGSVSVNTIYRAPISDPATFSSVGTLSYALNSAHVFVIDGYVYLVGGQNGSTGQNGIYRALLSHFRPNVYNKSWTTNWNTVASDQSNVTIGGVQATNISVTNPTTITATTPSHAAGPVNVTVTNYDGQSSTLTNAFTYIAPPAITSITPNSSLKTGGDTVTITGSDFYGTPTVSFGGTNASSVTLVDSNTLSVVVPAHNVGTYAVVVTNPDGQTSTLTNGFTFNELSPTVSSITPTSGPAVGGTNVTISGTNFSPNYKKAITINNSGGNQDNFQVLVTIDTASLISSNKMRSDCGDLRIVDSDGATNLPYWIESGINSNATKIWVKVPSIPNGSKTIYLTYGLLSLTNQSDGSQVFDFFDDFIGSSIDTNKWNIVNSTGFSVSGGNLNGTNTSGKLLSKTTYSPGVVQEIKGRYATLPMNGYTPGGFYTNSNNQISWLLHPGNTYYRNDGSYINKGDQAPTSNLLFQTKIKNASTVNLSITNLDTSTVYWNVGDLTNAVSNESILLGMRGDDSFAGQGYSASWDWVRIRKYAAIEPAVSIGSEQSSFAVNIGGSSVTNLRVTNPTTITATTPSHAAGPVNVTVTNYDGQSATLTNAFTYIAPPTITSITPNSSLKTGGDTVTITGSDFYGTPTVSFGGTNASSVTLVDSNTLSVVVPAHNVGTYAVVVTNPDGQTSTLTNGFTFNELSPTVSSITPTSGPAVGGTNVTISGTNFIAGDFGNGADGNVTISANKNINTDIIATGRTCADAINYSITALTSNTATLSTTPAAGCLAAGDEILLINLQGISTNYANVGNYETVNILSINGNIINFTSNKTKYYGNNANDDTNIGTTSTNQRVMLQRVPNYINVTINSGITLTANGWDGTKGGILYFKANGTVTNNGVISMNGKGFPGGAAAGTARSQTGYQGASYIGSGVKSMSRNFNGSGGGGSSGSTCGAGSGGGHANVGLSGASDFTSGTPGDAVGNIELNSIFLGGGGGGGGTGPGGTCSTGGGYGAGAIYISTPNINSSGTISANGGGGGGGYHGLNHDCAPGGGGAGGTIYLSANNLNTGTVTAIGGSGGSSNEGGIYGGAGSTGRIRTDYLSNAPTTNPTAYAIKRNFSVSFDGAQATNINYLNSTTITAVTPAHVPETVDVTVTNYDGQSATLSASYTFNPPPAISAIIPNSSPKTGGDTVTITGSEFKGSPTVKFGSVVATSVTLVDANTLSVVVPAHASGTYDVTVINPDGQISTLKNGFTFNELSPTVSSITPTSGPSAGGTNVTISGTNFIPQNSGGDSGWVSVSGKTLPTALYGSSQAVIGDKVYLFGGYNGTAVSNVIYSASISDPTTWTSVAKYLPGNLYQSQLAIVGNNIYLFGGGNGSTATNVIYTASVSDPTTWTVVTGKTLPGNIMASQLAIIGNNLYLFGGYNGSAATNVIYTASVSDPTTWTVVTGKTLPGNLYASQLAVLGDNIYMFGGYNTANSNVIYTSTISDPTTWTVVSGRTLPATLSYSQLITVGEYMYLLGGYNGSASVNTIYRASIADPLTWIAMPGVLPGALRVSNSIVVDSYVYLFGGYTTVSSNAVYRAPLQHFRPNQYDPSWKTNWFSDPDLIDQSGVVIDSTPATNIVFVNSTTITATTPTHVAGPTDVTVTNYDGQSSTLSGAFTFINPPTITSISPNEPTNNQSPNITITGQDFRSGATIKLSKPGQADIICNSPTFINSTTLTCSADFHGVEPGAWTVAVTNSDGQSTSNGSILNVIGEVTQIKFTTAPLTIKPDTASSGIRIALADVSGREIPSQSNVILNLQTDSATGSFSLSRNDWQPVTQVSFNIGDSSKAIYYKDATLGIFNLNVAENPDNGWTDDSQEITISKNAPYTWPFDEQADYTYDSQTTDVANSYVQLKDLSGSVDLGTGSDGDVTISANKNINTDNIATGRTCADAINYSVTALTTNTATLSTTPAAGCVTAGDEMLLVDLQGISSNYANVGNYETLKVGSVSGNLITFTQNKTKYYGNNANDDTNIGTAATNQRVMLQRVPNYQDVTINSGITLTANSWDGTKGGVLYFKANGTVQNSGVIDMTGKGYQGAPPVGAWEDGRTGESYVYGQPNGTSNWYGGGGGGQYHYGTVSCGGAGGAGGGYGTNGNNGSTGACGRAGGIGGASYGSSSVTGIFFGSGGGGSGDYHGGAGPVAGGRGGGIIMISGEIISGNGSVQSKGLNGTGGGDGGGGGGSGGSIWFSGNNINLSNQNVSAVGGNGGIASYGGNGGSGGVGRIAIFPSTFGTVSGTTIPAATVNKYSANKPIISNVASANLSYSELTSFTEDLGPQNQGSIKYQLSNNGGSTWYWWNGSTWANTSQGVAQANDAATINSHVATFHSQTGQIGVGKLSFRAYMISSGAQLVQLDSINVGYKIYPYKYVFTQVPSSLSETEIGTFVVQGQDQNGNVMSVTQDTTLNLTTSTPATGKFAIDLMEDESIRWDHTSVTIPEGSSSTTFYYTDALKGNKTISATSSDGNPSIAATTSQHVKSRYRFLVTGISDPVHAGVASSVTVNATDYLGNPTTDYTGTVHFSSTDAAAILPANFTFTSEMLGGHTFVNGITMMTQGEWTVNVTDASDSDISGVQTDITVTEPLMGTPSKLVITTDRQYVPVSNTSSPITVQLQDTANSPAARAVATTLYVSHTSSTGQLSTDGISWNSGTLTTTIPAGATSINLYFKDSALGSYVLSVSDDAIVGEDYGLTNTSQDISVTAGSPVSFELGGVPATLEAGVVSGPINITLKDVVGNTVSTYNDQPVYLTSTTGGEFSPNGTDNWVSTYNQTLISGQSGLTIYYRNTSALGDTITVSDTNPANGGTGLADDLANVNVTSGQIARYSMVGVPSGLIVGQASPNITIQAYDQYGNVAVATQNQEIYLYSSDANTRFSESSSPFNAVSSIIMGAGTSTATFSTRQGVNTSNITITASDSATGPDGNSGIIDATQTINISAGSVTSFALISTNPVSMGAGEESQLIRIESRNAYGVKTPLAADTDIYFHTDSTATTKEFSLNPGGGWSALTQTTMIAGSDTLTVYYKDTQAGSHTLTIGDDATIAQDDGITNVQLTANVTAGVPISLDITSAPFTVEAGTMAGPFMIYLKDQYGNTAVATSNIVVNLAADNAGLTFYDQDNNATNSVTIVNGTTNVSFNARSYEQQTYDVSVQASGLIQDNQQFTVNWGSPHSIAFIQSVANSVAGNISGPFTVELRNSHGVRVNAATPTTINLSTSRAGAFGADSGASFDGSFVASVIETGQAQTSFYYRATASGTHILTTQGIGLNYAEVSHSVAAANATSITFSAGEQTIVKENISSVYALISRDQFGNETAVGANEDITLSSDSAQAEFSRTQSPWNATLVTTINAGQSRANFYYKDYVSGVHHIEATSQFNTAAQNVNVIDAPVQEVVPTKYRFQNGSQKFIVNNEATFGFFLADNNDNYAKADREITATITSNSATGQFYDEINGNWNSTLNVTFTEGETIKSFKYHDSVAGNPIITISGDGLADATQQQTIENGNIEKITVTGTSAANTTDRIALTISLRTNTDLPVRTNQDVQINLFSNHAQGRFYASASSNSPINSTMIYTGTSQKVVYFQKTVPGDVHLTISESPEKGWTDAAKDISITAQGTHLRFTTGVQTKVAGTESDMLRVQLQDYYGNVVQAQTDITLHISSTSSFARFSRENGSNWSNTSEITLASGTDTASFFATDTAAGTHSITVSDVSAPAESPDSGIVNAMQSYIVSAAQAHSIALLSGANQNLLAGQTSAPITVQLHDQYGNARTVQTDTRLYISASSTNALFSLTNDFSPSHLIESFVVPAGSSVATFYFKDTVVEHVTISISSEDPTVGMSEGVLGIFSAFADEVDLIGVQAEMEVTMGDPARLIWESLPVQQQAGDDSVTAVVKLTNQYSIEMTAPNDIPVYFSTSSSEGEFALASTGPWNSQLSGNIEEGESRLTVYYRDTQVGSPLLTASDISAPAEDPDTGLSNATGYVDVVFGNPTKIVFTSSPQTIIANHESTQMRVQLQNSFDVPTPVASDTLVYLRSSNARGTFSTDGATWGINGVLVHSGQDQATFFYRDPIAGTPTVSVADSLPLSNDTGLTNATQQQTITAQVVDHLHVTNISDPQFQGTPSSMVVRALDSEGYVVETYDGTLTEVKAYDSTDTEEAAILPEMPYVFQPDVDRGIKTFTNAVSFLQNGEKKVTVEDDQGHTGQQENITVTTPPAGVLSSLKFIDPNSALSVESDKRSQLITLQLQNENGEPWNATEESGYRIRVTSSSDKGTFSSNGTDWNDSIELVVPKNLSYTSFYYHDTKSGSFELLATDWEGSLDNEDIENDILEGTTTPDVAVTFALSGNNTQTAGEAQNLSIIARDINGNIATGYTGVKTVTLSGASTSPSGKKATCRNSSNDAVELGLPTDLEFSAGIAVCELDLFAAELTEIEATDGTITTIDNQDQDLNVTVSPNMPHVEQSVISASPNPQMINSPVHITVAPKDRYGNVSVDSTKELIAAVSGANAIENLTLTFNETSKLYETTYAPTLPGTDLIRVKLEGVNIQKDTEGSNDGIFHETIEGEIIKETSCIEKLSVDSYNSDSFNLAVCIRASDEAQSDKIDRSKNGDSDIYQLTLEADSSEDLEGKLEFTSYAQKPDSHELGDPYADSDKYDAYKYFRVRNDFVTGKIKSTTIAMRISKSWIDEQNVQNITAVRLDSSDSFSMSRTDNESADYYVYQFDVSDPEGYWAIMGERGQIEESQEIVQTDQPQQPVQPTLPIQEQVQLHEEGPSEEKHETLQQVFSSPVDNVFADIISSDDPQQVEEAKRIANVVAGTAATAAAIPMLPNILGLARMLSAMPLKRRKKWGIVYDADSGEPVAHALISIIGSDGRVKEVKTTDQNGSYFFNARAGSYTLEAFKEGYEALSNVHSDSFHTFYGQSYDRTDVVALQEDGIVSVNVPLHIEEKSSNKELFSKSVLMHSIFWAGFIISGFALVLHPGVLNLTVFAVFAVNFIVNTFIFPTLKGSKITDANGLAVPFASIKIFDTVDGKLVMRTTTNEKGIFAAILSPGEYELQVDAGTKNLKIPISTRYHKELRKHIKLS